MLYLYKVCRKSTSDKASTTLQKYGCLDLVIFREEYDSFLSHLNTEEKNSVLCMKTLLSELFENFTLIKDMRNDWIAHIKNSKNFYDEITKPLKYLEPEDFAIIMNSIICFIRGLKGIFFVEHEFISSNYTKKIDEVQKNLFFQKIR